MGHCKEFQSWHFEHYPCIVTAWIVLQLAKLTQLKVINN